MLVGLCLQGRAICTESDTTATVTEASFTPAFSAIVYETLHNDMPQKGGYGVNAAAGKNLRKAVCWNDKKKELDIQPTVATPSFCSGACYLLLVKSLKNWEEKGGGILTKDTWKQLAVKAQADGVGVWGRVNSNGPGFAKIITDIEAGENFTDLKKAVPGDFLKFFWTNEIGCKERGHMVVYLDNYEKDGIKYIVFWSANKPDGYSIRHVESLKMHNLIFTRITEPQNFNNILNLPKEDKWLQSMLKKSFTYKEVCKSIGIKQL